MKTSVSSRVLPLHAAPRSPSILESPAWRHQRPVQEEALLDQIAESVEILRNDRGWSLAELARRAGLSMSQAKHMTRRRGNPGLAEILGLANAFGVTIGQLTGNGVVAPETILPDPARYDLEAFKRTAGTRLRAYRRQKRISIQTLAQRSHLSTSTIRSLELNMHTPALRTILRVCRGFNLSLAELVDVLRVPRVHSTPPATPGVMLQTLLRDAGNDDAVHLQELQLRPGQTYMWPLMERGSTAMAYVLEGTVRITSDGTVSTPAAGEATLIPLDRPFSLSVASPEPARCLLVVRAGTQPKSSVH